MLSALLSACAAEAAPLPQPIAWTIHADEGDLRNGEVQLSLRTRAGRSQWHHSSSFALASLAGLSADALRASSGRDVAFTLSRPAGRLACEGVVRARSGAGECRFAGDTGFAEALARRGVGRPDERQLFSLAMAGADLAILDELARRGYPKPTLDEFVELGIFKVTPASIRALADSGYRLGSAKDLVKFAIFKITPDYIAELAAIGPRFRRLPAETLVKYRIHKVTPATVRELVRKLTALGYDDLDGGDVVSLSIHGVTPAFIRDLRELGYRDLSPGKLVELRIHGVTPDYIRGFQRAGLALPPADQLTRLRLAGFDPARRRRER